jgi:hypothetical protein
VSVIDVREAITQAQHEEWARVVAAFQRHRSPSAAREIEVIGPMRRPRALWPSVKSGAQGRRRDSNTCLVRRYAHRREPEGTAQTAE